eukprot:2578993-Rhodomonas_salina.1
MSDDSASSSTSTDIGFSLAWNPVSVLVDASWVACSFGALEPLPVLPEQTTSNGDALKMYVRVVRLCHHTTAQAKWSGVHPSWQPGL